MFVSFAPPLQAAGCPGSQGRSTEPSRIVSLQFETGQRISDYNLAGYSLRAGQIVSLQFPVRRQPACLVVAPGLQCAGVRNRPQVADNTRIKPQNASVVAATDTIRDRGRGRNAWPRSLPYDCYLSGCRRDARLGAAKHNGATGRRPSSIEGLPQAGSS